MKENRGVIVKVFLSILMISFSVVSNATTYYVSNTGNDSNSGLTISLPWKTISKVNTTTLKAGDQILFQRGGTFYGSLTIRQSGISGNPIVFGAYGTGSNPVVTGFTNVAAWTNLGGNIWESTSTVSTLSTCNMVTFNGVNTAMGRYPDANATNGGYLTFQSSSASSITSSDLTGTPNWTGAQVVIRYDSYNLKKATISSQSGNTLNFVALNGTPKAGYGYFIQNDIRCCNQQNEWYYNPSTKKLRVASAQQPVNVNVASIDNLITINGNYVRFENISCTGANICGIYSWNSPHMQGITITNCAFNQIGYSAIYVMIDNLSIEGNSITESNCNAISAVLGTNVNVRNNTIQNIGVLVGMRNSFPDPLSLANITIELYGSKNCVTEYNIIKNVGYSGISASNALIKNNFIDTFCTVLEDGGGIYGSRNSKIMGNVVLNGIGTPYGVANRLPAAGIYLDQGSQDVEISYNTVANCYMYGLFIASLGNVNSHHNTAYNNSEIQYRSVFWGWAGTSPTTTDQVKQNIFVAKTKEGTDISSKQKCLGFYFVNSSGNSSDNPGVILKSTTLDSNYYARPIGDDKVIAINVPNWNDCWKALGEWQSYSGKDPHSHKSAQALNSINDFQFEYNATKTAKTIPLTQPMIDVKGTRYAGSITLQPFTSLVLMKDYSSAEILSFTLPGQTGNSVINTNAKTISITMPSGTSLASLKASFTLPSGATVKIGTTPQVSGTTVNNFTSALAYDVTAQDGVTIKKWTVTVTLSQPSTGTEQIMSLKSGWNTVSFNVLPSSTNFNTIFEPLIQSGTLVKIQDEKGHFMVNTADGWYSNLESLDTRKGYNVKVNADTQLTIKGQAASANTDIPLTTGFNIIGYPLTKSQGASSSFQNLISEGSLIKVQDETGKFIIKNGASWYDGIDSLQPGKGYYVNVTQNTNINFGSLKSSNIIAGNEMLQGASYFQKAFEGNPYSSMNFVLRNLSKSNLKLNSGDEIGIFDGNTCVGNFVYDGSNIIGTSAGMCDQASQINGFTPGDTIKFQIWKPAEQTLIKNITAIYLNNSSSVFTSQGTAIVELQAQLMTSVPTVQEGLELKNYPNPFVDYTSFEFTLDKKTNISLEIYDLQGRKVIELTNKPYEPGSYTLTWDGKNQNGQAINPGVYIYSYRAGSFVLSKKIIFGIF
jgi:hypothetical protein